MTQQEADVSLELRSTYVHGLGSPTAKGQAFSNYHNEVLSDDVRQEADMEASARRLRQDIKSAQARLASAVEQNPSMFENSKVTSRRRGPSSVTGHDLAEPLNESKSASLDTRHRALVSGLQRHIKDIEAQKRHDVLEELERNANGTVSVVSWNEADEDPSIEVDDLVDLLASLEASLRRRIVQSARRDRSGSPLNRREHSSMVHEQELEDDPEPMADLLASMRPTLQRRLVMSARRARPSSPKTTLVDIHGGRIPAWQSNAHGLNAVAVAIDQAASHLHGKDLVKDYS